MYTNEDLEKLADLGVLPSHLGIFNPCDEHEVEYKEEPELLYSTNGERLEEATFGLIHLN